ncbi:hypothetical protein GCM10025868_23310 [Angustibacter aerolatus]|uniref:Uncharacterized protein n=1 Tax=Angustibacter aerolatus TaxID=1162965 RepID=A0ABQ6JJV1_9ACTN|nr:hypothetical protein GCM10025868_23310 [Angustibacter aerolatus]
MLAEQQDASGTVTLEPDEPFEADTLVVWFTQAAAMDGGFRAEVADVQVR